MSLSVGPLSVKLTQLSEQQIGDVERFVDSLLLSNYIALIRASAALSEPAFAAIWNNPEDDVYDAL